MKAVQKVILFIFITVFFSLNTYAAGSLDACGIANSSGLWTIENDINDGATGTCINITVDNVILDCQGHRINSTDNSVGNYGIYFTGRDNITVQNCIISNWGDSALESGLYSDSTNSFIRNIISEFNYYGSTLRMDDSNVNNMSFYNNSFYGFEVQSSNGSQFSNLVSSGNGHSGLFFGSSNINNQIDNIISINNALYGIYHSGTNTNNNNFLNFNISNNLDNGLRMSNLALTDSIFSNGYIYANSEDNIRYSGFSSSNNLFKYIYVEEVSEINGSSGGMKFDNMFWDNISLFDPCVEITGYNDICDNNPKLYVQQSEQLRIEMLEYADETVTFSPLETATGQYAGTSENFSNYNITGYLIVSNNNPNSETLSNIYLTFDHTSNMTLPIPYAGRTGTWLDNTPSDGSLYLHIPELRGGENLTYIYSVNTTNVKPPLNVTSNYSDFKLLAGDNFTIQDTLSNNFDAATYQGDVCIYDIIFNQSASSINFSGTFYDFTFNSNSVNGSDYNHVTTSSDNMTQTWDVFNGGCLYNNNNPYITYNMSTPNNIPTSQPYEAVNTSISYTIDATLSQFRLTNIRAIGEEGINFEKQIVAPSDPILYGSNVTWNVSGGFRSDSDITYDLEQITYWVSKRNYNGSFTDPNSFDNDSISGDQLNISFYPNNLTNTLNPWVTSGWLFNYSDIPSPIVWMDVNLTIRNDNYQLINRSITQNGDNYHIKEIYLIIGYWLEVEKNISLVAENTYQIRIDVHNKGNQVTPQDSIVTIYDFVPSNFNISSGFVYSNSSWYSTSRANNSVTGVYNGTLQQWAIIPTNSLNTSFAQGPSKNINTSWSATFNVTGQGDYTLLDIFITGLDPQKVDGAGSTRAVIVEEFVDKLKSTEGIFAVIAFVLLSLSFMI